MFSEYENYSVGGGGGIFIRSRVCNLPPLPSAIRRSNTGSDSHTPLKPLTHQLSTTALFKHCNLIPLPFSSKENDVS